MTAENSATEATGTASEPASAGNTLVITRTVNAPRNLVFEAWTDENHLAKWWGPKGFTMLSCKLDLRPGGRFHYGMRSPDGHMMWGVWVFREIVAPERIVFVSSFSDEEGNVVRAPFSADWPLEVLSTVTFAEQDGKTTLTLQGIPETATESERGMFESMFESMQGGWSGTLSQLEEFLAAEVDGETR